MEHLGQFLQGFTQQVGAVIDDHVAELQVHMLPLSSPPGIRGAPASCQSLPGLPAGIGKHFMHHTHARIHAQTHVCTALAQARHEEMDVYVCHRLAGRQVAFASSSSF